MQNARGFKKRYILQLILLAALSIGGYQISKFSPLEQSIVKKVKVNNLANLYITEANAGATTDFSYRFYLFDASKSDNAFMGSLRNDTKPFLVTSDRNALQKVDKDAIYLSVKGAIFAFNAPPAYRVNDSLFLVPIYLTSVPF